MCLIRLIIVYDKDNVMTILPRFSGVFMATGKQSQILISLEHIKVLNYIDTFDFY